MAASASVRMLGLCVSIEFILLEFEWRDSHAPTKTYLTTLRYSTGAVATALKGENAQAKTQTRRLTVTHLESVATAPVL